MFGIIVFVVYLNHKTISCAKGKKSKLICAENSELYRNLCCSEDSEFSGDSDKNFAVQGRDPVQGPSHKRTRLSGTRNLVVLLRLERVR